MSKVKITGSISAFFTLMSEPHNSKTNNPKVFKLGIGNDHGISYKWHGFRFKGQLSTLWLGLTAIRRGFKLYECFLVIISVWIIGVGVETPSSLLNPTNSSNKTPGGRYNPRLSPYGLATDPRYFLTIQTLLIIHVLVLIEVNIYKEVCLI